MKRRLLTAAALLAALAVNALILAHSEPLTDTVTLSAQVKAEGFAGEKEIPVQIYYSLTKDVAPGNAHTQMIPPDGTVTEIRAAQPAETAYLRLDPGDGKGTVTFLSLTYRYHAVTYEVDPSAFLKENGASYHNVKEAVLGEDGLVVRPDGEDPYILAKAGPDDAFRAGVAKRIRTVSWIKKIIYLILIDGIFAVLFLLRHRFATLPRELIENRSLIMRLARNDFKTKFAGSVFGVIWAFIQPIVTVLVYWFVFGMLGSGPVAARTGVTYPFVLWLLAGLVPWFFFQEAMIGGTNALIEYSYLVKKVVFKISILPIVKEVSALFVHLFFVALMFVLYIAAGHFPDLYWLQVIYYSLALFLYCLAVLYSTCSIVIFFRDLTQVINIIMQVQIWMTPIMWNYDALAPRMPGWAAALLRLNPLYYIVTGYRDSMMNKVWFFQRFDSTVYFWLVTAVLFGIGTFVFKRLKVHFADIL